MMGTKLRTFAPQINLSLEGPKYPVHLEMELVW
jgi:hypothetical protein